MAQYARPASDITTDWTTTPLWSKLDEVSPDDADFITGTGATKTAEVKLSSVTDPNDHANHIWSLRLKATGSSAAEKATVTLYQGLTSIEVLINNQTIVRNAFNLWTGTLVNAANITDYSDLRIRLVTGSSNGAAETIQCSWIEFSVPNVPATQLVIDDASHTHGADGSIDLTQHNVLAIDDAAHTNTDDGPLIFRKPAQLVKAQHQGGGTPEMGYPPSFQGSFILGGFQRLESFTLNLIQFC